MVCVLEQGWDPPGTEFDTPALVLAFTFMHLAEAFIQSDLQCIQVIHFSISMSVPWESNPQPFMLLTQCSTTEPQEQAYQYINIYLTIT